MSQPTGCEGDALEIIAAHLYGLPSADACLSRIGVAMAERQKAGIASYGQPLDQNDAPLKDRFQHLWEELLDAQAYAAWIRRAANLCVPGAGTQAQLAAITVHRLVSQCLYEVDHVMEMLKQEGEA